MTIRPVRDQIVALPQMAKRTDGGLYIPETAEEEQMTPKTAKVLAVGPGKLAEDGTVTPPPCSPGDIIVYRPGYGNYDRYTLQGKPFLLLEEKNILAVLEESPLVVPVSPVVEVSA